jgi:tRNA 5-methylaminomethyl-2-thiouridine biosynthesis bifunctional protein
LLQAGEDWQATGVTQLHPQTGKSAVFHPSAAWVKPAALVRAWLSQPGIEFCGDSEVASLEPVPNHGLDSGAGSDRAWRVLDAHGKTLAQVDHVVFACAHHTTALWSQDPAGIFAAGDHAPPALQGLHGQVSWAHQRPELNGVLPVQPINGLGSLVAHIPWEGIPSWFVGATYETLDAAPSPVAEQHMQNLDRLRRLLPACAAALEADFHGEQIQTWSQTRCVTNDRLPAVGPLLSDIHSGIWINVGMGSRGLSFAALCAELLASRMDGGPLPVAATLARSLDSQRFAKKVRGNYLEKA